MTNENLKQTMQREWQNVRKMFYYPQLPQPQLVEDIPNGQINIENLEIKVGASFIKELQKRDIPPDESLNEILSHETTHFMKYPGSVLNILRLQKAGQEIAEKHKIGELRKAFVEAQTNIYLTNEIKHTVTAKIGRAYGLPEEDVFGRLMYGLYQKVSGQDFGIKPDKKERTLINKLKEIEFLDKKQEIKNFKRFAQTLKDYQLPQDKKQGKGDGQGKGQGKQGNLYPGKDNSLEIFTDNQIREGLKQFAQECSNPNEYEEIVKQVLNEGKEQGQEQLSPAMEKRAGSGRSITQLADNFYTALAEKHSIPIRKKPMKKNGSLYPYSHTNFEIGDPITEVDPFSTPGILPGITKKWVRKEGEVYNNEEAVPDNFTIIDNSPSMFMPNGNKVITPSELIYQHLVGATAISNTYLINNSKVAVYSFGSNDHLTHPTKNRELVHKELRRYSISGGTTFSPKFLEGILKESKTEYDISVISDMAIRNLDSFVETVLKIPQTHRIHLLYTEKNQHVEKLRESFGNKENVAILPLISENDIYQITMGELKKSVK